MKNFLGGGFYLAASIYLAATKPLDLITAAAIAAGLVMAGLTATRYADWAAFGGGLMIAVSLFLQSLLSYRCLDCIRADVLILAGVISLSVLERGRHRCTLGFLSAIITVFVTATIAAHYDPPAVFGMEPAGKTAEQVIIQSEGETACPEKDRQEVSGPAMSGATSPGQTSSESAGSKQPEKKEAPQSQSAGSEDPPETVPATPERFIQVRAVDGRNVTLDAAEKPILFFSPTCGACVRVVEALAKADPEGRKWVPVQAYGDPVRGRELLKDKGYRGVSYVFVFRWSCAVPAMVAVGSVGAYITTTASEMLKIVRGDAS